jgi:uncharacterized protein YukE
MADSVQVDTDGLRRVATDLAGMADRVADVLSRLTTSAANDEGRWGNDDPGRQFANGSGGQPGYVGAASNLETIIGSKTTLLQQYSDALNQAADLLDRTEHTSGQNFRP